MYAWVAPEGFYWLDSAALSAGAVGLGSPHPTGLPLYYLLGKLAQLVPLGEMAFRVALLSAAAAGLAVLWATRLCFELAREDVPGLVGATAAGATLAVSYLFARQATIAGVDAPAAAFMAGALLLFTRVARGADARHGLALAVVCGLGLGIHGSFLFLGPPVVALLGVRLYRGARWPLCAPLLTVLVAGALYLYLPVRSASGHAAELDGGHPRTAGAFWAHVSTSGMHDTYALETSSTPPELERRELGSFIELLADSVGPLMLLCAFFGMLWLFRQRRARWPAAALAALAIGDLSYSLWIDPAGARDLESAMPVSLAVCVAGGVGVAWLARYLGRVGPYAGAVLGVVLVVTPALYSLPAIWPASSGDLPRVMVDAGFAATPPGGVILVHSDSTAAGMLFASSVEGVRPDAAVLARRELGNAERVRAALGRAGADTRGLDDRDPLAWIVAHAPAVTWELGQDPPPLGTALAAGMPLARLVRSPAEAEDMSAALGPETSDIRAAVAALERIFDHPAHRDRVARRIRAQALEALGHLAFSRGELELAEVLFGAAIELRPAHAPASIEQERQRGGAPAP